MTRDFLHHEELASVVVGDRVMVERWEEDFKGLDVTDQTAIALNP